MSAETVSRTERIAQLNDLCRRGVYPNGRHQMTRTLRATLEEPGAVPGLLATSRLMKAIREYEFAAGDGPERDFGAFDFDGHRICFKTDYYEPTMVYGSEDPSDPPITARVMTIMLTSDY